jgi:tetratricopeptide (TPR) repeat protein
VGQSMNKCIKGLLAAAAGLVIGAVHLQSVAQGGLRPEVGKPLQAAQDLVKAGKYREALAKVRELDAVGGKSAAETNTIERMRLAAASGAGDADTAARSFDAISTSVAGPDKLRMIESIAGTYYRSKEYAKAMQWYQRYFREGGTSGANRTLLIQTQYLSGDFAGASKELMAEIQAAEKNGTVPAEERINLLMNAAVRQKDIGGETFALERLVSYYPKKEYWVTLLNRLQRKPNFSDRLVLDTYRLSLATGSMSSASDYMELAQLTVQAGYPAEGKKVVEKGFAAGVLGVGAEAGRHKRLRDLVNKKVEEAAASQPADEKQALAAKDGNELVNVGMGLVLNGQAAKGLQLMQQGIAKGGLKRPEDAKLHLGIAQIVAGDNAKAQATLRGVTGNDGTADLARLWALYARRAKA